MIRPKETGRMCNCNTVARNVLQLPPGQGYPTPGTDGEQRKVNKQQQTA